MQIKHLQATTPKKEEILLQSSWGAIACWVMDGTAITKASIPFHIPAGWRIVGYADFNQDGQKDLVLEHTDGSLAVLVP